MPGAAASGVIAPKPPSVRLSLAVTGHRVDNASYAANRERVSAVLAGIFGEIDAALAAEPPIPGLGPMAPVRLHTLLADGVDQLACHTALARGWELVSPLPFGADLNRAINAKPRDADEARLLMGGEACLGRLSVETRTRAQNILTLERASRVFELADQDDKLRRLYLAKLEAPNSPQAADAFAAHSSERVGAAARVMLEQADILIGVWDGASHVFVGGTGHTIAAALQMGAPVVWIDTNAPEDWRILRTYEALAARGAPEENSATALGHLIRDALRPTASDKDELGDIAALDAESWRPHSDPLWHTYRRIEALFGGERPFRNLRQTYEAPDAIVTGSAAQLVASLRALPGADEDLVDQVEVDVLGRFAWADAISSRLSDAYRGGMIANFVLSALAVISGIAYLPFLGAPWTPIFSVLEILLLGGILGVTWLGQRRRWHQRWFQTRRVGEYFRHAPILLALGVTRPPGRWPAGAETSWPEWYARYGLREVGLPEVAITQPYLRAALTQLIDTHVVTQRDYHLGKAARLTNVHSNMDRLAFGLFVLALISVAGSLVLSGVSATSLIPEHAARVLGRVLIFLDVVLPTFGGAIAGIRYFGEFERFAAISEVTANKLEGVHARLRPLLAAPDSALEYALVADLAHRADDIVVDEIENWQAMFGNKNITVPV